MSKSKLPVVPAEKKDAFTRILQFLTKADITLNPDEEIILDRWIYCDAQLRGRKMGQDEIIEAIKQKWGVSKYTAMNDINQCMRLFERSRQVSKKYLLHHHIEEIGKVIAAVSGGVKVFNPITKTESDFIDYALLPRLFDSYTKAIEALPDDQVSDPKHPPIFKFILAGGGQINPGISAEEAMKMADTILMQENTDGVFSIEENE